MPKTESFIDLRAEVAKRDEDYRIARKHANEAAARDGTEGNIRAYKGAERWAQTCLKRRQEAHARLIQAQRSA